MKSVLKWLVIIGGGGLVLIIAAALIIPKFVDIKKYKPTIEEKVTQATGRSFSIGDDMDLSIFPWVGVRLTDIRFGNPEGYAQKEMVAVKDFEVRLKVMPLLSRQIEVKTFVLDSPMINLTRQKNGTANWEGIGPAGQAPSKEKKQQEKKPAGEKRSEGLPIASLKVGTFSIVNGQLNYLDAGTGVEKKISDFNLKVNDISLDRPVSISFDAKVDGQPIALNGNAGPIGKEPGKGTIDLELAFQALNVLAVKIDGKVMDPAAAPQFDLDVDVASFSPRDLMKTLGQPFPVKTADSNALNKVSLKATVKGSPSNIAISGGQLVLDDSKLDFSAAAKAFSKPDIAFDLKLDAIDLDRYLPEPPPESETKAAAPKKEKSAEKTAVDYTPLRKLVMDGKIHAGKIKAHGASVENLNIQVKARDGVIRVDPFGLDLYQGTLASVLELDVTKNQPQTSLTANLSSIQVGPLLKDALQKEIIEGTLKADIDLTLKGDDPATIKKTLNGKGGLLFNDGAIIGIDLPGMVRNVKAKLGAATATSERPKTDFAELNIPFTAKNGLVRTDGARMMSPLIRLLATGDINLVTEMLDMRLDPKFVATLKGQGDEKERSGLMVPLLITGSFASPKIRPDLKGMIGGDMKDLNPDALKRKLLGGDESKPAVQTPNKEAVQKKLKSLIPGLGN
jgi:AsmA protein